MERSIFRDSRTLQNQRITPELASCVFYSNTITATAPRRSQLETIAKDPYSTASVTHSQGHRSRNIIPRTCCQFDSKVGSSPIQRRADCWDGLELFQARQYIVSFQISVALASKQRRKYISPLQSLSRDLPNFGCPRFYGR